MQAWFLPMYSNYPLMKKVAPTPSRMNRAQTIPHNEANPAHGARGLYSRSHQSRLEIFDHAFEYLMPLSTYRGCSTPAHQPLSKATDPPHVSPWTLVIQPTPWKQADSRAASMLHLHLLHRVQEHCSYLNTGPLRLHMHHPDFSYTRLKPPP